MEELSLVEILNSGNPIVLLNLAEEDPTYGIIHIPQQSRNFFPGYKVQFALNTDVKPFVVHVTGGNGGDRGSSEGSYLCHPRGSEVNPSLFPQCTDATNNNGSFFRFYEAHPELSKDSRLVIEKLGDFEYQLHILKTAETFCNSNFR